MDRTSYHRDQRDWSDDQAHLPDSMKTVIPERPKKEEQYAVSYMRTAEGRILLDHDNHPTWSFEEIPLVLSTMFEPIYMDRIRRESKADRLIVPRDFWARMPWTVTLPSGQVREQYGSNRLSVAMTRLRESIGIAPIIERRFTKDRTKILEDFRREDVDLAHGKRGLTSLQKLKVADVGLGKAPENAAAHAISERDRKLHHQGIRSRLRRLQATVEKSKSGEKEDPGEDTEEDTDDGWGAVAGEGAEEANSLAESMEEDAEQRDTHFEHFNPFYGRPLESSDGLPTDSGLYWGSHPQGDVGDIERNFAPIPSLQPSSISRGYTLDTALPTGSLGSTSTRVRRAPIAPLYPNVREQADLPATDSSSFASSMEENYPRRLEARTIYQPGPQTPLVSENAPETYSTFAPGPMDFDIDSNTGHSFYCGCDECLQAAFDFADNNS